MSNPGTGRARPPFATSRRTLRFGAGAEWSSHQLALTAASTAGVAVHLAALSFASGEVVGAYWLVLLVPATTMAWAGSGLSLGLWTLLLYLWFTVTPAGSFSWWSVAAAAGLLLSHSAVSLSATAPPSGLFGLAHLRRRRRSHVVALAAAVVVAAVAALLSGRGLGPNPVAYAVGLLGVVVGVWLTRSSPPRPRD